MGNEKKFNPKCLERLRNPERETRENIEVIWNRLALVNPDCVIDIGAGIGYAAIPFAKKMSHGTVWACDISTEMLAELDKEIKKENVSNVKPLLMGEVDVPLPDVIADAVLMQNLHHEFDDPIKNLLEVKRLLKSGGKAVIIDWKKEETPAGPPLEIRVTGEEIMEQLSEAGFGKIESFSDLPYHSFVTGEKA
ncbi:MAG: class I SAM-dependent methyltransferase [Nitrospinota bacterium]|nr:class I SAM-dependent methyltransferase [Nitrospinota bacterium]